LTDGEGIGTLVWSLKGGSKRKQRMHNKFEESGLSESRSGP